MNWQPKIEYTDLTTGTPTVLTFDGPPEGDPYNEGLKVSASSRRSTSGVRQTQWNYNIKEYKIKFRFQSNAIKILTESFLSNHAYKGGEFKYFPSSDEVDFETMEIKGKSTKFKRTLPDDSGDFEYDFTLSMERVV